MSLVVTFALFALVPLLLSRCSDPVTIGQAAPGEPLGISVPVGEEPDPSTWPDACDLISDDELLAILPQAEEIERRADQHNVRIGVGERVLVPTGVCWIDMRLPGGAGELSIWLEGFAGPDLIAARYQEELALARSATYTPGRSFVDHGDQHGMPCYTVPSLVDAADVFHCQKGPVLVRFDPGSATADFDGDDVWRDQVMSEVIRTVAANLA